MTDPFPTFAQAVRRNLAPRLDAFYGNTFQSYDMSFHGHSRMEIMLALTGRCRILVRSRAPDAPGTREIRLREGEFVFLDAGTFHRLVVDPGHPCRLFMLEIQAVEDPAAGPGLGDLARRSAALAAMARREASCLHLRDSGEVFSCVNQIQQEEEFHADDRDHDLMRQTLFSLLFLRIARALEEQADTPGITHVRNALRHIGETYDLHPTVEEVARHVGIHPAHLQRLFRAHLGETVLGRVQRLRLEKAAMMLLESDLPVVDIAVHAGFNSRQGFGLAFRRHFGVPPAIFRKQRGSQAIRPGERILVRSETFTDPD